MLDPKHRLPPAIPARHCGGGDPTDLIEPAARRPAVAMSKSAGPAAALTNPVRPRGGNWPNRSGATAILWEPAVQLKQRKVIGGGRCHDPGPDQNASTGYPVPGFGTSAISLESRAGLRISPKNSGGVLCELGPPAWGQKSSTDQIDFVTNTINFGMPPTQVFRAWSFPVGPFFFKGPFCGVFLKQFNRTLVPKRIPRKKNARCFPYIFL